MTAIAFIRVLAACAAIPAMLLVPGTAAAIPNCTAVPTPEECFPPAPTLTGEPANGAFVRSRSTSFTIRSNGGTIACKLDRATVGCGGEYSGLADGSHTIVVTATSSWGFQSSVSRQWTVDNVAPEPTVSGAPAQNSTVSSTTTMFSIGADGGTLTCTLDGSETKCTGTYSVAHGPHKLIVTSSDAAGNVGHTSRSWTVDTRAPVVSITAAPAAFSNVSGPSFTFLANEPATFECSLDAGVFETCASTKTYATLTDGAHSFAVRGTDTLAHTSAPVSVGWTIDTVAPDTNLLDGPPQGSTSPVGVATFAFGSTEPAARFECRLDDEPFGPCATPLTRTPIATGDHLFAVRAIDAAGNTDASPAQRSWRVNILDADADGFNAPQDCDDANPAIHPGVRDTPDNGIDEDCSGSDAINFDRDGDGYNRPQDCRDNDAAVHPGARDVPRNKIDEDCSGSDARYARLGLPVWTYGKDDAGTYARITHLSLKPALIGSTVRIKCDGRGCPFGLKTRTVRKNARQLILTAIMRRARLRPGARLEVRVTKPGMIGAVLRLKVVAGGSIRPTDLCLPPRAKKPIPCTL